MNFSFSGLFSLKFFLIFLVKSIFPQDYHVKDFNATGDGKTDDTNAVRAALKAAENSHGGRVIFDDGYSFLTGAFQLTNNIILDVRGEILGSNNSELFVLPNTNSKAPGLITVYPNSTNITISGGGIIDGQGFYYWIYRCFITRFFETLCITLTNSPNFNIYIRGKNIHIYNISIINPGDYSIAPNTDGIHLDSVQNVLIENCLLHTGDDALGINSDYGEPPTNNVTVRNITVTASHGLSIGAATTGGIQNVWFDNIFMNGSLTGPNLRAISTWGGHIQNITYTNIQIYNPVNCFKAEMNWTADKIPDNATLIPKFVNISIHNFTCVNSTDGGFLQGLRNSEIEINLSNIQMTNIEHRPYNKCENLYGKCDNSTVFPYCPPCLDKELCQDTSTDCSRYLGQCTNAQYHNLLCNLCRKTCNLCNVCT